MTKFFTLLFVFVLFCCTSCGNAETANTGDTSTNSNAASNSMPVAADEPDTELARQIDTIADDSMGRVGAHSFAIGGGKDVSFNADERFSMQSVVKVPISMAVLRLVEQGKLKLDEKIEFSKDELVPDKMHSPLRDKEPNGGVATLEELIEHAVSESDGTAADVLQRVAGGADDVNDYVRSLGIDSISVRYTHKEFSGSVEKQKENWATPRGVTSLLHKLYEASTETGPAERALTKSNADLLLKFMTETKTGPKRLKGLLPKDVTVAHKTGTSGTVDGMTAATNDAGIMSMPDGRHIIIAVFVGDSRAETEAREAVIARIAKAVYDKWLLPETRK